MLSLIRLKNVQILQENHTGFHHKTHCQATAKHETTSGTMNRESNSTCREKSHSSNSTAKEKHQMCRRVSHGRLTKKQTTFGNFEMQREAKGGQSKNRSLTMQESWEASISSIRKVKCSRKPLEAHRKNGSSNKDGHVW